MILDISKVDYIGVVIVSYKYKGKKTPHKVYTFNSRLQVFKSYREAAIFEVSVLNQLREEEPNEFHKVHYVSVKITPMPPGLRTGDKYYCPYCGSIEYLGTDPSSGYKQCPICHCSMVEYYFMRYNDLWLKDQKQGNTGKKVRKKRKGKTNEQET